MDGLLDALEAERAAARVVVVGALSSDRYLALLGRLDDASEPPGDGDAIPLRDIWRAEWKRTRKALSRLDDASGDSDLHAGRIRVKRVRYAAELAAHELGKRGRTFVEAAKELQDVLGAHQDATVAEERIRAWAAGGGDAAAASLLLAREDARKEASRGAWPEAWTALRQAAKQLG